MFRFTPQHDQMDCGPACLAMIASAYGKYYDLQFLRDNSFLTREGVSLLGIGEAAKNIGFDILAVKVGKAQLEEKKHLPAIIHWNQNHFVVLHSVQYQIFGGKRTYKIADPAHGWVYLDEESFDKAWMSTNEKGVALFLTPTPAFFEKTPPKQEKVSLRYLFNYLLPYKKQLIGMFFLLLVGSILSLIAPFLTQNLIDKGVNGKNIPLIGLILIGQLGLFSSSLLIQVIRNHLTIYVGTKINITLISDFLKKLLRLPIRFFDTKLMGDFQQRILDHERIEHFLTSQSLMTFFSMLTFSAFFAVLWYYDWKILSVYAIFTVCALLWSAYFLKKRRVLDYYRFQQRSENQESLYEILNGVTEMKLNQFEDYKRHEWEMIQEKLFTINLRILRLDQIQISGFDFINQIKNILVTFMAALYVIKGAMTLGELLSVSFIIGQMNAPIQQLVGFFRSLQDAKLSLERLNEVQAQQEEDTVQNEDKQLDMHHFETHHSIYLKGLNFQYSGPSSPLVLEDIEVTFPAGKITAVVGASGSGKTTLMKLLLKFYEPTDGSIYFDTKKLEEISTHSLRANCGVVMQDGFIFSDSIERNIATSDEHIDQEKLQKAIHAANLTDFVSALPLKLKTKIGASGNGISGGQKQRILIARAVYKNPKYLFFDEATSALDAHNERIIHENLQSFFQGKTVIIIAHRLSTVKKADQIIVLDRGKLVEVGNHTTLTQKRGYYYELVKDQLELGN